jgi:hypothetical protein
MWAKASHMRKKLKVVIMERRSYMATLLKKSPYEKLE